jgi:YfiR/HmsC-like
MLHTAINVILRRAKRPRCFLVRHDHSALASFRHWALLAVTHLAYLASLLAPLAALSQDTDESVINREYPLKAIFIYNFATYIDWPSSSFSDGKAPFSIGVLGSSPIDETLNQIAASKQIAGRRITISHFALPGDVRACQILFVPRSVPLAQQERVIDDLRNQPVLLVGETEGFAPLGGDVNFFVQTNRIRFEINLTAMKQQQLKASSKLLAMAKIIEPSPPQR